jgi:integrase/recombinase XerD
MWNQCIGFLVISMNRLLIINRELVKLEDIIIHSDRALANARDLSSDNDFINMFIANKKRRSENTARVYKIEIKKFRMRCTKPLREITFSDLVDYAESIQDLSINTQARCLSIVRSLFRLAKDTGYIPFNPAEVLTIPQTPDEGANRYLTPSEVKRLLETAKEHSLTAFISTSFILLTGVRISEFVTIKWCDFYEDTHGNIGCKVLGKGKKYRNVKIREDLWNIVKQYRGSKNLEIQLNQNDKSPLIQNKYGNHYTDRYFRKLMKSLGQKANINKNISPHWLRHTNVTFALDGGASIRQVQNDLGHSSPSVTQRYDHMVKQLKNTSTDYINIDLREV